MEVSGHQPAIDRVQSTGTALVKSRHFASDQIKEKRDEVKDAWKTLLDHGAERKRKLNISLHKQQVRVAGLNVKATAKCVNETVVFVVVLV